MLIGKKEIFSLIKDLKWFFESVTIFSNQNIQRDYLQN